MAGLARVHPIDVIRSLLKTCAEALELGSEGAPNTWLEVNPFVALGLDGLAVVNDTKVLEIPSNSFNIGW